MGGPKDQPSYMMCTEQIFERTRFPLIVNSENSWAGTVPSRVWSDNLCIVQMSALPIELPALYMYIRYVVIFPKSLPPNPRTITATVRTISSILVESLKTSDIGWLPWILSSLTKSSISRKKKFLDEVDRSILDLGDTIMWYDVLIISTSIDLLMSRFKNVKRFTPKTDLKWSLLKWTLHII